MRRIILPLAVSIGLCVIIPVTFSAEKKAAVKPAYQKCDAWQDTMRVSRELLMRQVADLRSANELAARSDGGMPEGFEPWMVIKTRTDVPPSRRPAYSRREKIRIAGLKRIYLGSSDLDPAYGSHAEWGNAQLVDSAGKKTLLVSLPVLSWKGGEDRNAISQERRELRLGRNEACFQIDGKYEWLEGQVNVTIGGGAAAWVGGRSMYDEFKLDIDGRRRILAQIEKDFPLRDLKLQRLFEFRDNIWLKDWKAGDISELAGRYAGGCTTRLKDAADKLAQAACTSEDLSKACRLYTMDVRCREMLKRLECVRAEAIQLAVDDLAGTFGDKYPVAMATRLRLKKIAGELPGIRERLENGEEPALKDADTFLGFQREVLLANPLLDFEKLLFVKRDGEDNLAISNNFGPNTNPGGGSEVAVMSSIGTNGQIVTLFRDKGGRGLCDVDLDFDAEKMLFTMKDDKGNPQIWEVKVDGSGLRQITPGEESDGPANKSCPVQNCDACYLPDGRVIFISTATMVGVPCVGGSIPVGNLFRIDADGKNMMRLTFDQDQNWNPTVLNNGRVLYLRWEYTDTPHYFTRLLFTMNPDGTGQMEMYGSNSYWPNSIFSSRPIPGHPTKVVGIVTGHHGTQRAGELVMLDSAVGRRESGGAIQRIPGYGKKVEPTIRDTLVDDSWPKFLTPYPLSEKYFLVSCKLTPDSQWGIYLADVFDNLVLLVSEPGYAMLEPIPLRKTPRPSVVPDRIIPGRKDAVVYLQDVYVGGGLEGVPRGTVKNLRVFSYAYNYRGMGSHCLVGQESGWDVKRILGTVPVEPDGSAMFSVPANTPIALQPLDGEGRALQLMRSWMTARPGETLSCVGCHETGNSTPPVKRASGSIHSPDMIKPFYGPERGYSYEREIQPVLDKYCVGCHNGQKRSDGKTIPDFANRELKQESHSVGMFSQSYLALNPYVRRPGPESDYHMFVAMEWHADTSPLVQMLSKGHHNVKLDAEAWDRFYTWIDLNVPYYGTYRETKGRANAWNQHSELAAVRNLELMKKYANVDVDVEAVPEMIRGGIKPVIPPPEDCKSKVPDFKVAGWPFDENEARKRQGNSGKEVKQTIELVNGISLNMVLVPAGEFIMGDVSGYPDERPFCAVKIEKPFWMAEMEISNRQFAQFDPKHDSLYQDLPGKDQIARGYPANQPDQPVVRVSWYQAVDFCKWLSARTGRKFSLPTESQWEWACRCGFETAPQNLLGRYGSKWSAADNVGIGAANAWGLKDVYGNVSEWTITSYRPYPYRADDGRNDPASAESKVVRGGCWVDDASRLRAGMRIPYQPYRRLFNVGFRVVCE